MLKCQVNLDDEEFWCQQCTRRHVHGIEDEDVVMNVDYDVNVGASTSSVVTRKSKPPAATKPVVPRLDSSNVDFDTGEEEMFVQENSPCTRSFTPCRSLNSLWLKIVQQNRACNSMYHVSCSLCFGCVRGGVELNDDDFVCGYCVSKFNDRGINDDEFVKIVAYVKRSLVQAQINLRGQSAKVNKLICDDSPYARFVFDADEIEDNGELFDDSESEDDGDYAPPDADSEDENSDDYEEINVDASTSHLTTAATTLITNPAAANSSFVDPRWRPPGELNFNFFIHWKLNLFPNFLSDHVCKILFVILN